MNLNQLRGLLVSHRTGLMVAGAGGVAGIALWRRHQGAGAAPGAGTDSTTTNGTNAADQFANSGYSSAPFDTYDYFQQQLEALQSQLDSQTGGTTTTTPGTGPVIRRPDISNVLSPSWNRIRAAGTTRVQVPPSPVPGHPVILPHPGTRL